MLGVVESRSKFLISRRVQTPVSVEKNYFLSWSTEKETTEEMMDRYSVYRRLDCINRHLSASNDYNQFFYLNYLNGLDELKCEDTTCVPVVIGGMVLDIHAKPSTSAQPGTTTPGKVNYVAGGVARNIAECMSKLGTKLFMISVVGLDMAGNLLMEYWKSAGLNTEGIETRQDMGTPVVCNLFDANGEVTAGVASVEALEKFLTEERIQKFTYNIRSAPVVMIDANLSPPSLEASCKIAAEHDTPVWFEPVSVAKSKRIVSIARHVTFTSPNEAELIAMANSLSAQDRFLPIKLSAKDRCELSLERLFQMLKPAISVLLVKGIKIVVLTLGADGAFVCFKDGPAFSNKRVKSTKGFGFGRQLCEMVSSGCPPDKLGSDKKHEWRNSHLYAVHFPSLPASVVRLTGAGDCLVGGTLASICAGLDLMQSIAVGIAAAKAAVEVETNVPSAFCLTRIADDARLIYSQAKVMCDQPSL